MDHCDGAMSHYIYERVPPSAGRWLSNMGAKLDHFRDDSASFLVISQDLPIRVHPYMRWTKQLWLSQVIIKSLPGH